MPTMDRTGRPTVFYGYWILAASLVSLFIMSSVGFYSFGIFFKPIQEEFAWGRGVISVAFLLIYLVQAIVSPFIGRLAERYGPKTVITIGAFVLGSGLFLLSLTTNILHFYAAYALTGLGNSAIGMITISALISNWFVRRRGLAIGIASTGVGLGGLIATPVIGIFLIPTFGWRASYQILAILTVMLVSIPAQFVIKTHPRELGLSPDGIEAFETATDSRNASGRPDGWTVNAALHTSTFWLIAGAYVLFMLATTGASQHLINHLTDIGLSVATATTALSIVGLGSTVGKFTFGTVSDVLAPKYCAAMSFFAGIVSILLIITDPTTPIVLLSSFIMGLSIGGWAPLTSMLIGSNFGLAHYGSTYGVLTLFQNIGTGVSTTFYGYVYDATDSYRWAYIVALASLSVAILLIVTSRRPKRHSTDR